MVATVDDARRIAATLPRSYEAVVRGRLKFRVGQLVYVAFSADERVMGFAFPKEQRQALVAGEPEKFAMPSTSDLRYHWVTAFLDALDIEELTEIVIEAWTMVVPKKVAAEHLRTLGLDEPPGPAVG